MPDPLMPSLSSRDGIDAPLCACIGAGALTVSPANTINSVNRTSLPLPPTGEHNAAGGLSGTFLLPPCALCKHRGECPQAWLHDRTDGWMAPLPNSFGASTPSCSPRHVMSFENVGWGMYASGIKRPLVWVDGTLTTFVHGANAICQQPGLLPASLLGCPS